MTGPFLSALPHRYFDENQLHAFIISRIKDFDACLARLELFLPYIDNWATCDQLSPPVLKKHRTELLPCIDRWLSSGRTYSVRFAIGMLMQHFLDQDFSPAYLEAVAALRSEEYYVRMMQAWYFATALAKQYRAALPYLEQQKLERWTHNKAIQKALESYRITDEQKAFLAMTLAQGSDLVLLDEPLTFLDIRQQLELLETLRGLQAGGTTVLLVVHDLNTALTFPDRLLLLDKGRLAACGTALELASSGVIDRVFGVKSRTVQDEKQPVYRFSLEEKE